MDFHQKQWRNQQDDDESEEQQKKSSAKMPKFLLDYPHPYPLSGSATTSSFPLFFPESNSNIKLSNLSDSTISPSATTITRLPRIGGGGYFSLAQWQELELQALIYRYMLAGSAIPPELLQQIKKSLLQSPPYFFHHPLQHCSYYQPALLQTGYWGRAAMDPEPGRCRRTDGKKWRCSRDVVAGQKYCERHVHRGRNRSRKPVEIPTPNSSSTTTVGGGGVATASATVSPPLSAVTDGTSFSLSGQSPSADLLNLRNGSSNSRPEIKTFFLGSESEVANRNDSHILRHFFDDWPRSNEEPDNSAATCLSISMPGNSSDVSLKLSTGDLDEPAAGSRGNGREQPQVNWTGGWGTQHQMTSMGGPLAEALRSSTSNSSPTSVLHQLPRSSVSETSYVST